MIFTFHVTPVSLFNIIFTYVPYRTCAADISKEKVCEMELTSEAAAQFEFAVDTQVRIIIV